MSGLIKRKKTAGKLGVCVDTTYAWNNPKSRYYDPDFPKPIALSPTSRARFFIEEEIDAYIAKKAARREEMPRNPRIRRRVRADGRAAESGGTQ
jgi:prophage regulatory protein